MSASAIPEPASADRIAARLRADMLAGALRPGEPLRDAQVAALHGVSRNTVREAFRLLHNDGLTEHRRHRGTVVRRLSAADIRDVYVVRRAVELRAVDMITHATESALARIEQSVRTAELARDQERWQDVGTASLAFHKALVASLSSPTLDNLIDGVLSRLRLAFAPIPDEGEFQAPWIARDRDINDLLQRGRSAQARDALRIYLEDSESEVLGAIREFLTLSRKDTHGTD